jgi:MFS transporter, ACS family, aldohexuronate transporter
VSQPDARATQDEVRGPIPPAASGWAWGLCWLMFASTVLNYMDRQTVSLLREPIGATFGITAEADFGWVLAAFYLTYALFQVPAGYLVDRWDLRWSYAAAVAWWSLAAAATAVAPSLGVLIACRILLGVGESFNWPCALRVTARILPPSDRSLGNGIFNSGAALGAVVTPVVVTVLTKEFGWRAAFVVIGVAGFVWVTAWLVLIPGDYRRLLARPDRKEGEGRADDRLDAEHRQPRLSGTASAAFASVLIGAVVVASAASWYGLAAIWVGIAVAMLGPLVVAAVLPHHHLEGAAWAASLGEVVRNRRFWIMVVVSVSINICWHFLVNWIPTYLKKERGLEFTTGNVVSTIPFLASGGGNLLGGWLARQFAARGWTPIRARQLVLALVTPVITAAGLGVGLAANIPIAVTLVSVMAAATTAFMANFFSFGQEVSPRHTGLVVGYLGGIGNLFVAGFQPMAGKMKDLTGSFTLVFVIAGLAPLIGLAALLWGWSDRTGQAGDPDE